VTKKVVGVCAFFVAPLQSSSNQRMNMFFWMSHASFLAVVSSCFALLPTAMLAELKYECRCVYLFNLWAERIKKDHNWTWLICGPQNYRQGASTLLGADSTCHWCCYIDYGNCVCVRDSLKPCRDESDEEDQMSIFPSCSFWIESTVGCCECDLLCTRADSAFGLDRYGGKALVSRKSESKAISSPSPSILVERIADESSNLLSPAGCDVELETETTATSFTSKTSDQPVIL
jgi:hypothetical protein